jgi:hypothetical protein
VSDTKTKNQHWIPQFYLRRFAIPGFRKKKNAKIWVTDFESGKLANGKIQEVAAIEYLYSHIKEDGKRCYRIESKLAELETTIAELYPHIAEGVPDLQKAWGIKKLTALFITTLLLRHPENVDETKQMHDFIVDIFEKTPNDASGNPQIPTIIHKGKEFKIDYSDYQKYKAADENYIKQLFTSLIESEAVPLAETLIKKRWVFFCSDKPVFFASDRPVVMRHFERQTYGLGTPGVHLFFPICPTRMLWMTDRVGDMPDGFFPLPTSEAVIFNFFTVANATLLFSHQNPDAQLKEIDAFMKASDGVKNLQPKFTGSMSTDSVTSSGNASNATIFASA